MLLHRVPQPTEERRSSAGQGVEHVHELPELPEGVTVPDDLRGLEPPTAPTGRRWLLWVAVVAVAVIAVAVALVVRSGGETELAEPTVVMSPASEIVQSEIDAAIAQQRVEEQIRQYYVDRYADYLVVQPPTAAEIVQAEIDAAIAGRDTPATVMSPAAEMVQSEIDAAIAAQGVPAVVMSPAAEIIQNEIEHAMNEQAVLNDILEYYENLYENRTARDG